MLLPEAAMSMNCSVVCTMPRSSRYLSFRSRCVFASAAVYQLPSRLNSHTEVSSRTSNPSISALAAGDTGAAFAIAAVVYPKALLPLYRPWMKLAEALGWLNTRIILILVFYLIVTPIGLVMRLFRRSPLDHAFWSEVPKHSYGDKHYEKQF